MVLRELREHMSGATTVRTRLRLDKESKESKSSSERRVERASGNRT